jgi:hypothetical protein
MGWRGDGVVSCDINQYQTKMSMKIIGSTGIGVETFLSDMFDNHVFPNTLSPDDITFSSHATF